MRIAIDTQTTLGQSSGFGSYVTNLVKALKKFYPDNEYNLICPSKTQDLSTIKRFIWDQFTFPNLAKKEKVDILHQPCFSAPIFYSGKKIVTVHDIIPLIFPHILPFASRMYFSKWMTYSYRHADSIICDSKSTKKDIIKYLKIRPEKIKVIYLAVSDNFKPAKSKKHINHIKNLYKTGDKYFIHIGTMEPRKNLDFLIKAYFKAVKSGVKENLVIVGKKGYNYQKLYELVDKLNLQNRVIFTGYAEDKDIPALYSGATALTFPSIYEGFGFPPLEAMACGTPVIASNASSIPEVVGSAGILLSPKNENLWVKNMIKLANSPDLAQRLKRLGLEQAKKFSWEKTARETIEIYKRIINEDSA